MASSMATAFQSFNKFRKTCIKNIKDSSFLNFGMGDNVETGNLWIVPGFTVFFYAILWTTKLSNISQEKTICRGANLYKFEGSDLHEDVERYCYNEKRYYVGNESIQYNQEWKDMRKVKNPEWILWFWAPILLVLQGLTRFFWQSLMNNQDIDFDTVKKACQNIIIEEEELNPDSIKKINTCFNNIKFSSDIFARYMCFKIILILSPLFLWLFLLPLMIGQQFRTWGFDVAYACWENRNWQGVPLKPFFASNKKNELILPLLPKITFCDYPITLLGDIHIHTYQCTLDSFWHERTALITWSMLAFLTIINFLNLLYWVYWATTMSFKEESIQQYMLKKWFGGNTKEECGIPEKDFETIENFANEFSMSKSLFLYFIELQTNHFIACKIAKELFRLSKIISLKNGELKTLLCQASQDSLNKSKAETSYFSKIETKVI